MLKIKNLKLVILMLSIITFISIFTSSYAVDLNLSNDLTNGLDSNSADSNSVSTDNSTSDNTSNTNSTLNDMN